MSYLHGPARAGRMPIVRLPTGWSLSEDGKRAGVAVRTKDFLEALDLFREVGALAEDMEHHPDLHLVEWNRVRIETWSHDVGGLTARDERLAAAIQRVLDRRGLKAAPEKPQG